MMPKFFRTLLILLLGAGILGVGAAQGMPNVSSIPNVFVKQEQTKKVDRPLYVPDEIIVKFKPEAASDSINQILKGQEIPAMLPNLEMITRRLLTSQAMRILLLLTKPTMGTLLPRPRQV